MRYNERMTEDERKTMVAIASAVDALRKDFDAMKHNTFVVPTVPPPIPAISPMGRIEHSIEHRLPIDIVKFEVQFAGAEFLPYEERMAMTEKFLRAMRGIFSEFGVISLTGSYTKTTAHVC